MEISSKLEAFSKNTNFTYVKLDFCSSLIWGQIHQECQEYNFPIIPRTAGANLEVKIQVVCICILGLKCV